MKDLRLETAFKKDLKRITKRDYDRTKLEIVVTLLRQSQPIPPIRRDHQLKGVWQDYRECHLESDWLLIYKITDEHVVLARTGTHADLFE